MLDQGKLDPKGYGISSVIYILQLKRKYVDLTVIYGSNFFNSFISEFSTRLKIPSLLLVPNPFRLCLEDGGWKVMKDDEEVYVVCWTNVCSWGYEKVLTYTNVCDKGTGP